jgi:hypothetical protein
MTAMLAKRMELSPSYPAVFTTLETPKGFKPGQSDYLNCVESGRVRGKRKARLERTGLVRDRCMSQRLQSS